MSAPRPQPAGPALLQLVDEALWLLRQAPARAWAAYLLGAVPLLWGLLYFWSDMSRSAFAERRLAWWALLLSALFVWLKLWQTVYTQHLLAVLDGRPPPAWSLARLARVAVTQAILQPLSLLLLPLALLPVLTFGWVYAFYQHLTVLADGERSQRQSVHDAWSLARLWPRQNLLLIWLFSPWVLGVGLGLVLLAEPLVDHDMSSPTSFAALVLLRVFEVLLVVASPLGAILFFNYALVLVFLPQLLKLFLGVDTAFTLSTAATTNTTFLATVAALTWLTFDPLLKALYVLRTYYGLARHTGVDLLATLAQLRQAAARAAQALLLGSLLLAGLALAACPATVRAADTAPATAPGPAEAPSAPTAAPTDAQARLNAAIERTLAQPEFSWRLPRDKTPEEEAAETPDTQQSWLARQLDALRDWLAARWDDTKEWRQRLVDWLDRLFKPKRAPTMPSWSFGGLSESARVLAIVLLVLAVALLAVVLWRTWRQIKRVPQVAAVPAPVAPVSLEDPEVTADALPEDGWRRLAAELMARGEHRLALRALFLALLALLGERELVRLAKYKSNREYAHELERRAHALPTVPPLFGGSMALFERVWYGRQEASAGLIEEMATNLEQVQRAVVPRAPSPSTTSTPA